MYTKGLFYNSSLYSLLPAGIYLTHVKYLCIQGCVKFTWAKGDPRKECLRSSIQFHRQKCKKKLTVNTDQIPEYAFKHLFVFSKIQPKDILDTETKYPRAPICLKSSLFF